MNKEIKSFSAEKMADVLQRAQKLLTEAYPNDIPISAFFIVVKIYANHTKGLTTTINELAREIGLSEASVSRAISKMATPTKFRHGIGYIEKEEGYNDSGRPIKTCRMTEKGAAIMERILNPMD